jgi:hypothetical protein
MRTCQGLRSTITFFCRVYASVALPGVLFNGTDQTLAATLQSPLWASTRRRMSICVPWCPSASTGGIVASP